eukprot:TRINITY_DN7275_c0_g1_i3.p1 TRINITY_DN7275_c0_g1~~TRINITY_DN7275_c0_g1_i3.p1  ORF type:complete len:186 (-),score=43.41 TRINITY_DN7275_c0_g1_i3:304-861(-)
MRASTILKIMSSQTPILLPFTMNRREVNLSNTEGERTLSKNLQNMKFMQRGREAEIRDKLRAERERAIKDSQWVTDGLMSNYTLEEDTSMLRNKLGRRSFGKFNPPLESLDMELRKEVRKEREKYHQNHPKTRKDKKEVTEMSEIEMNADVPVQDMVQKIGLKRKNSTSSHRPQKKRKVRSKAIQ